MVVLWVFFYWLSKSDWLIKIIRNQPSAIKWSIRLEIRSFRANYNRFFHDPSKTTNTILRWRCPASSPMSGKAKVVHFFLNHIKTETKKRVKYFTKFSLCFQFFLILLRFRVKLFWKIETSNALWVYFRETDSEIKEYNALCMVKGRTIRRTCFM